MKSAAGVITEYNPFHNGHLYHLQKARDITSGKYVIAVMSGNFTQRGVPACLDKWQRAKMALRAGVDLVLELPTSSCIRGAHSFARGAVQTLAETGMVDEIIFGSEQGNIEILEKIASILAEEPIEFKRMMNEELKNGLSFLQARNRALDKYYSSRAETEGDFSDIELSSPADILSSPNNILGIEYIKNIKESDLDLEPKTIKRKGADYHDEYIEPGNKIASATSLRKKLYEGKIEKIKDFVPQTTMKILYEACQNGLAPADRKNFSRLIPGLLRQRTKSELRKCPDSADDLVNSIIKSQKDGCSSFEEIVNAASSKTYTEGRVRRVLLQTALRVFDYNAKSAAGNRVDSPQYLRVLAAKSESKNILGELNRQARLPVITNPSSLTSQTDFNSQDDKVLQISLDLMATDIFTLLYPSENKRKSHRDFYTPVIE